MVTQAKQSTSDRAVSLQRTFASAFLALSEHAKLNPGEASDIAATVQNHLKSAWPSATMLDSAPFVRVDADPVPAAAIERAIGNGSYRVSHDAGHVVLMFQEEDGGPRCAVLTCDEVDVLRADLVAVKASVAP